MSLSGRSSSKTGCMSWSYIDPVIQFIHCSSIFELHVNLCSTHDSTCMSTWKFHVSPASTSARVHPKERRISRSKWYQKHLPSIGTKSWTRGLRVQNSGFHKLFVVTSENNVATTGKSKVVLCLSFCTSLLTLLCYHMSNAIQKPERRLLSHIGKPTVVWFGNWRRDMTKTVGWKLRATNSAYLNVDNGKVRVQWERENKKGEEGMRAEDGQYVLLSNLSNNHDLTP